jgi:hypothetical protein
VTAGRPSGPPAPAPAPTSTDGSHTVRALLTPRRVRVAVGALWLLDAALQAQPRLFGPDWWRNDLAQSVMGQPHAVARSILWVVDRITWHPAPWNGLFVAVQALLGLCLLAGRFEKAAIVASIPWALGIWWIGEGFGALPTGFGLFAAGAPGPVLYYPLLGLLAWPHQAPSPPSSAVRAVNPGGFIGVSTMVWAALWAGAAMLLLVPGRFGAGRVLRANLEEHSLGQPAWLAGTSHHAYQLVGAHPLLVGAALAAAQTAIGLGVFFPRARRIALGAGIVLAVVFWIVFENLGGIAGGGATDPGAAPLLIILALSMWHRGPQLPYVPATNAKCGATAGRVAMTTLSDQLV